MAILDSILYHRTAAVRSAAQGAESKLGLTTGSKHVYAKYTPLAWGFDVRWRWSLAIFWTENLHTIGYSCPKKADKTWFSSQEKPVRDRLADRRTGMTRNVAYKTAA